MLKIKRIPRMVGDPEIVIWEIIIEGNGGIWKETLGSPELARTFLERVRAAFSFTGESVEIPEIPDD